MNISISTEDDDDVGVVVQREKQLVAAARDSDALGTERESDRLIVDG